MGTVIGAFAALLGVLLLARRMDVVEVRGRSMAPTLLPGDRLLAVVRRRARVGDIVLAADPRGSGRELVKRVASIDARGVTLRGDNRAFSTDSQGFGGVPATTITWHAVLRYWPPGRIGPLGPPLPAMELVDEGGEPACTAPEALIAAHGVGGR